MAADAAAQQGESPSVVLIAAVAGNGVIGRDGDMPWRLSTDLRRFKSLSMGKPIVMGRKTFQSIGKPLPGRATVVVSRDPDFRHEGVTVAASLQAALAAARKEALRQRAGEICVVGGGEIYRQAIDAAERLYITHVEADIDGDTTFPPIDPRRWCAVSQEPVPKGEKDSHPTRFVEYRLCGGRM